MKKTKHLMLGACLLSLAFPMLANATATRLTNYGDLLQALKNGHRVTVVADNSKCKDVGQHEPIPDPKNDPDLNSIIGMNFNSSYFLTYRDDNDSRNYVATIVTNTVTADQGSYQRYKRIKIYEDNTAALYFSKGDFSSGKLISNFQTICNISNGHDQNGVSLFDYDA